MGDAFEWPVGVHRNRVTDRLQHREVQGLGPAAGVLAPAPGHVTAGAAYLEAGGHDTVTRYSLMPDENGDWLFGIARHWSLG